MEIVEDFKLTLGMLIKAFIDASQDRGAANEAICAVISAEGLVLAAYMHQGDEIEFIHGARRAISLVRTGAIEQ